MDFETFKKLALTTLVGLQHENGSWSNDPVATISAIDALCEECGGPDPVCRFSGLHALLHPEASPRKWLFPFSWGLHQSSDDPRYPYVAAVYHAIGFGWRELPRDRPMDPAYAWLLSKWLRINVLTDADFQLHIDSRALAGVRTKEPWLLAQVGYANLHGNHYFDVYPKRDLANRPDILRRVQQLLRLAKEHHWEGRTITPEETTAITGCFLAHDCTLRVCRNGKPPIELAQVRDESLRWLFGRQASSGGWADSPHITAHCLKFIDAAIESLGPEHKDLHPHFESLQRGVAFLLNAETQAGWCPFASYQQIDVLATLIRLSKRAALSKLLFETADIDGTMYSPDVFISYGGPDATFAKRLAKDFEANGIRVWFAEWDLDYGDDVVQSIERGLIATKTFVIVLSPEAIQRPWVRKELSAAFQQALSGPGKLIIPVMYRRCQPPPFLAAHRWADFTDAEQYPAHMQELVRRLKGKSPPRT